MARTYTLRGTFPRWAKRMKDIRTNAFLTLVYGSKTRWMRHHPRRVYEYLCTFIRDNEPGENKSP